MLPKEFHQKWYEATSTNKEAELLRIVGIGGSELWRQPRPITGNAEAVWAVLGHFCSTDDEPMHSFCPANSNTWYESRSFFRVHTGYFSNIPKCIKAEFIASWACSQSSVVSSSKR
ncbi:hypothetical protein TNCV_4860981 [Trichonephila clavipes]|nr:hypothetical protein TNCV_4860981 [Trichonephila clavipes]